MCKASKPYDSQLSKTFNICFMQNYRKLKIVGGVGGGGWGGGEFDDNAVRDNFCKFFLFKTFGSLLKVTSYFFPAVSIK